MKACDRTFLVFVICALVAVSVSEKKVLKSIVVLFRHGDKAPTTSFPNDPYFDNKYWPMGFGELLDKGKLRHFRLGQWLRSTYADFLPAKYNRSDVHVFSTDVDRALMSAQCNLAGLYPLNRNGINPKESIQDSQNRLQRLNQTEETKILQSEDIWYHSRKSGEDSKGTQAEEEKVDLNQEEQMELMLMEGLSSQPVPIHTAPDNVNGILRAIIGCPTYQRLYEELANDSFLINVTQRYKEFYSLVSNLTGWKIDDLHYFAQLQSIFYVYKEANPTYLPIWHPLVNPNDLEYLAALHYSRISFNPKLAKLSTGIFFNDILKHFDQVLSPSDYNRKLYLISGHEENLAAVLHTMGVYEYRVPKFASAIIWELYEVEGKHYINMLYRESEAYIKNLTMNCNDTECDYDWFRNKLKPILMAPGDRKKACDIKED
nr:unnamed protein product [Callosobruchus analis]